MNGYTDNPLEDEEVLDGTSLSDGLDGCYLLVLIVILLGGYLWLT